MNEIKMRDIREEIRERNKWEMKRETRETNCLCIDFLKLQLGGYKWDNDLLYIDFEIQFTIENI